MLQSGNVPLFRHRLTTLMESHRRLSQAGKLLTGSAFARTCRHAMPLRTPNSHGAAAKRMSLGAQCPTPDRSWKRGKNYMKRE